MPAATSKLDLIAVTKKEYAKLRKVIDPLDTQTSQLGDEETTIKGVVGHRAHWIKLFLGWYHDGLAGKDVQFPAPGYNWGDLKRYNAVLRARQTDLSWDDARELLEDRHAALLAFLSAESDDALYGGPMRGAKNSWTAGRWAEAAGASHYRSATKVIRAVLRAATA